MHAHKGKQKLEENIFLCAYSVYLILSFIGWTNIKIPSFITTVTNFGIILLLSVGIINSIQFSKKNIILLYCLILICLIVSYKSSTALFLILTLLFIIYGKNVDYHIYVKLYYVISTIALFTILFLAWSGILKTFYWNKIRADGNVVLRSSLGFKYTTFGPLLFMCSAFSYLSLKNNEINIFETLVILILNYFFYTFTDTRAVYFLILFTIISFWVKRIFSNIAKSKFFCFVCVFSIPVLAVASIGLPLLMLKTGDSRIYELDAYLSNRLYLGKVAISRYGISNLFGNSIIWSTASDENLVDSSYLRILLQYGWVTVILVTLGYMVIQFRNCRNKNYGLAIVILFFMIHSFTDPQLLSLSGNPFLILLGSVLNKNEKNNTVQIRNDFKTKVVLRL